MNQISVKLYPIEGGDVRRFPFQVSKEGNGYYRGVFSALLEKVKTIYPTDENSRLELAWKDDDGDMIFMFTDEETKEALSQRKGDILRIYVRSINGAQSPKRTTPVQESEPINIIIDDDFPVTENETPREQPKEPQANEQPNPEKIHRGIICDGCDQNGIKDVRFKCLICHDYDLCATCEGKGTHNQHPMIRLTNPDDQSWMRAFMVSQAAAHRGHGGMPCRRGLAQFFGHHAAAAQAFQQHNQQEQQQQRSQDMPGGQFLREVGQAVAAVLNGFGIDVDVDVDHEGQRTKVVTPKKDEEKPEEKKTDEAQGQTAPVDQPMENVASPPATTETMDTGTAAPENQDWMILENPDTVLQQQPLQPVVVAPAPTSTDPRLNAALETMLAMGFTNEGGWLTQLLEAKRGDIDAVLEILHPSGRI